MAPHSVQDSAKCEDVEVFREIQPIHVGHVDESEGLLRAKRPDRPGERLESADPFGQQELESQQEWCLTIGHRAASVQNDPGRRNLDAATVRCQDPVLRNHPKISATTQANSSFH